MKAKVLNLSFIFLVVLSISGWGQSTDKIIFGIQIDGEPFNELSSGDYVSSMLFKTNLNSHYMIMTTRDDTSSTRFFVKNGFTDPLNYNWFVAPVSDTDFVFLDSLLYDHQNEYTIGYIMYLPYLHIRVDNDYIPSHDTLAILNIRSGDQSGWASYNKHDQPVWADTIYTDDFKPNVPRNAILRHFVIESRWGGSILTYQIVSTGKFQFAVDTFKVSNLTGEQVMNGVYDSAFSRYAEAGGDSSFFWQLRDDMKYDQLLTTRHLGNIIADSTYMQQRGMIKPWLGPSRHTRNF